MTTPLMPQAPPRLDLIISHADCADGLAAAWALRRRWPSAVVGYARYNEIPLLEHLRAVAADRSVALPARVDPTDPQSVETARACLSRAKLEYVAVTDFSFPAAQLQLGRLLLQELVVLDHHVTAERDLAGQPGCVFDMERSGAQLAWDYAFPGEPRPLAVEYVADRDLWRFELPESRAINFARQGYPHTLEAFADFQTALEERFEEVAIWGRAQMAYYDRLLDGLLAQRFAVQIQGRRGVMAVGDRVFRSDLGAALLSAEPGAEFAAVVSPLISRAHLRWALSLRSEDGRADVAEMAEVMGGGGHRNAAGAVLSDADFRALVFPPAAEKKEEG